MIHKYWSNQNIYSQFPRIITVRLNIYFYTAQNTTISVLSQVMYLNCTGYLLPFNLTRNILVNKSLIIWHEGLNIRHIHTLRVQIVFTAKKMQGKNIRFILHKDDSSNTFLQQTSPLITTSFQLNFMHSLITTWHPKNTNFGDVCACARARARVCVSPQLLFTIP
jgi:hypothetical protein